MRLLKPFTSILPDALQPVALKDGTMLFVHRDTIRHRTCIITAEDLRGYSLSASDDYAAAVLPVDADIAHWIKANFPCEKPVRSIIVFGKEAAPICEETSFEAQDDKPVKALEKVNRILKDHFGQLVIREFNTEEERNAYYKGIDDGQNWVSMFNFDELQNNPFTEEEIKKQLKNQGKS